MEEKVISSPGSVLKQKLRKREDQFSVSAAGILKNLKRFFALWIALSVVVSLLAFAITAVVKNDDYKKITSVVSFTFDGVEKGLDPNGNKFYVNSMKSTDIINKALDNLGLSVDNSEEIRRNITFEGIIPQDAIERITTYTNVFDNESISSEQVADKTYYPTQYRVHFDYAQTGFSGEEAAGFVNELLECYNQYFFDTYGFNKSLENSLNSFDYRDYDYAEAVEVFDSVLKKLSTYISQVSATDTTRFRSSETSYTFADLTDTISTLRNQDLDIISSYVTLNTVTKDKETLLTYYMYKIEALQRKLSVCNETLAAVNDSIANYKKNTVMVFGSSEDQDTNIAASEASAEYDKLFDRKQTIQRELSSTAQEISLYNKRIERLNSSTQSDSASKKARVEEDLSRLDNKVNTLIDAVSRTTDDYYKTVVFPKAYNVLEPASSSMLSKVKQVISDSIFGVIFIDACIFIVYLLSAVILSCVQEYRRLYGKVQAAEKTSGNSGRKKAKKSAEKQT